MPAELEPLRAFYQGIQDGTRGARSTRDDSALPASSGGAPGAFPLLDPASDKHAAKKIALGRAASTPAKLGSPEAAPLPLPPDAPAALASPAASGGPTVLSLASGSPLVTALQQALATAAEAPPPGYAREYVEQEAARQQAAAQNNMHSVGVSQRSGMRLNTAISRLGGPPPPRPK